MRVLTLAIVMALLLALLAAPAFAINPHDDTNPTGQPNKECREGATLPPGFNSPGFENAETHYAGEDETPSLLHANSDNAVSQYDVACFQRGQAE